MAERVVALDFGSTGVRAVQFALSKKAPKAEKFGFVSLPRGAVDAGEIKDSVAVTVALKELWKTHGFTSKHVMLAVANQWVMVRQMDLGWMEKVPFEQELRFRAAEETGLDSDKTHVDYHVLAEYEVPGEDGEAARRMMRVLMVVATHEMISAFVDTVQAAGLLPLKVELLPFALMQAAAPQPVEAGVAEAVIEIGADVTSIVVHQGGQPRFVRIYSGQGGNAVTDELMRTYGWKFPDAERTKIALGIRTDLAVPQNLDTVFETPDADAAAEPAADEHPAQAVINNVVAGFVQEVRTSLGFFLATSEDVSRLSRVVLTGGGSLLKGLAPRLASELRLPVEYGTPLATISVGGKATVPTDVVEQQLSAPIGLALGASR